MTVATILPIPLPPAERLARLIEALCTAIAAHGVRGLLTAPLILLLWSRLRRMAGRARQIGSRIEAGRPLAARRHPPSRPAPRRPYLRLSRSFAWLVRAVPATACGASQLQFLLTDPAMTDLADTKPMRRLLSPLCRLLGVHLPPAAKPPPPCEAAAPKPVAHSGEAPRLPPEPDPNAPPLAPPTQVRKTPAANLAV